MSSARLASLLVGGSSEPWEALGFRIDPSGRIPFGNGALEFTGNESGMRGLTIADVDDLPGDIEGIVLSPGRPMPALDHPNGGFELDHVVVMSDSLERTSQSIERALGLPCKRIRETDTVRQAFHRFADGIGVRGCIIEVVENKRVRSTGLFGLVINVDDLDGLCERHGGDVIGAAKAAVQPGRRIATVRSAVGLGVPLALMTPG